MPEISDPAFAHTTVAFLVEPDGVVTAASPVACEVLGRPAEEVIGRPLGELVRGGLADLADLVTTAASEPVRRELVLETRRGPRVLPCVISTRVDGGRTRVLLVGGDLDGRRILVADDHPMVRADVHRMLARRGATVVLAEDGAQAERHLREAPFDLAILDVVMPGRTGYQVLATARVLYPELPVILMSGDARGVGDGGLVADRFLEKPFPPRALAAAIDELLARAR